MQSPKLYEIANQVLGLQALIDDGELDAEILQDTLEGLEGDFTLKVDNILALVANEKALQAGLKAEEARLASRRKTSENAVERLLAYVKREMGVSGFTRVKGDRFSATLTKGRDVAVIEDPDKLPDHLFKVTVTRAPVKADILAALKAGEEVPGASLGLSEPGLRIR